MPGEYGAKKQTAGYVMRRAPEVVVLWNKLPFRAGTSRGCTAARASTARSPSIRASRRTTASFREFVFREKMEGVPGYYLDVFERRDLADGSAEPGPPRELKRRGRPPQPRSPGDRPRKSTMSSAMPTRLIVNADDFGLAESVNLGVVEAFDAGALKSATVLACGRAFEHAVSLARTRPGLDLGVHLCLDEETPILPPAEIPSLVDAAGRLQPRARLLAKLLFTGGIDLDEVRRELAAQVERCLDAGLRLSHFDGHGHVHVYPRINDVVVQLARSYGLRAMSNSPGVDGICGARLPAGCLSQQGDRHGVLSAFEAPVSRGGLVMPDQFVGMVYGGRLSPERVTHLLAALRPGGSPS